MVDPSPEEFVGVLTTKKYISITRSSPATAKRDIQEMIEKKILISNPAKGRSASYRWNTVK